VKIAVLGAGESEGEYLIEEQSRGAISTGAGGGEGEGHLVPKRVESLMIILVMVMVMFHCS
jgi:hypothetical protein